MIIFYKDLNAIALCETVQRQWIVRMDLLLQLRFTLMRADLTVVFSENNMQR